MTDIVERPLVERLRTIRDPLRCFGTMEEAADEIERLQVEVKQLGENTATGGAGMISTILCGGCDRPSRVYGTRAAADRGPQAGDKTICVHCGRVLVFVDEHTTREASKAEHWDYVRDQSWLLREIAAHSRGLT